MGIAVTRFHDGRLVSVRPKDKTGFFATRSFVLDAQPIFVDVTACSMTSDLSVSLVCEDCAAQILDTGEDARVINAQPIRSMVDAGVMLRWSSNPKDFYGKRVHLRFDLVDVKVYGLYFGRKPVRRFADCN